jgi:L-glyceraldehyde 3-phosphate reductase
VLTMTTYAPSPCRYEETVHRRCGRGGILLVAISLGLSHNFGDVKSLDQSL